MLRLRLPLLLAVTEALVVLSPAPASGSARVACRTASCRVSTLRAQQFDTLFPEIDDMRQLVTSADDSDPHPSLNACRRAAIAVSNESKEAAEAWLDEHIDDDDIDEVAAGDVDAEIVGYLRTLEYEDEEEEEEEEEAVVVEAVAETMQPVVVEATAEEEALAAGRDTMDIPGNAVVFDKVRHANYDYDKEAAAVEGVIGAITKLKRFGVDKEDASEVVALQRACEALTLASVDSPAPCLRDDPRLIGDWELIGTTSSDLADREGLTGLGKAPFTNPVALFYRFEPTGTCLAKEVLEFFGQPIVLNELRGSFGFSGDGVWIQEQYNEADMSGVRNTDQFTSATATSRGVCISADGTLRLGMSNEQYFVFKKLGNGEMDGWLQSKKLPLVGGTVPNLSTEEMKVAYPYLGQEQGQGGGGFKWPWEN